jgi:hypothetical protein
LIEEIVSLKFSGPPNSKCYVEKQNGIHVKLNGTYEEKIRKGEQILNGIVEEDETTTIPCWRSSEENHNMDKHLSKTLAESVGKLVNGDTSQVIRENYQVR